jgi:protein-tyrosine phosphatase
MEIISLKKEPCVDEILPNLYLGDIETSQDEGLLKKMSICHIINLSNDPSYIKWDFIQYKDIPVDDCKHIDLSNYFDECSEMIHKCRERKQNILVHCVSGVSRSVSIILNYLLCQGFTLKDAFLHVKKLRTRQYTRPNIGFFRQLLKQELKYKHESSMSFIEYRNEYRI